MVNYGRKDIILQGIGRSCIQSIGKKLKSRLIQENLFRKWSSVFTPYGYELISEELQITEDEAESIHLFLLCA